MPSSLHMQRLNSHHLHQKQPKLLVHHNACHASQPQTHRAKPHLAGLGRSQGKSPERSGPPAQRRARQCVCRPEKVEEMIAPQLLLFHCCTMHSSPTVRHPTLTKRPDRSRVHWPALPRAPHSHAHVHMRTQPHAHTHACSPPWKDCASLPAAPRRHLPAGPTLEWWCPCLPRPAGRYCS